MVAWLSSAWAVVARWVPFAPMTLLVVALSLIGEQYPFSNFPMYSSLGPQADVLFVTDQKNAPLPMQTCFRTTSSVAKKTFRANLQKLTWEHRRPLSRATPGERATAARALMRVLRQRLLRSTLPPGTTALRIHMRNFRATPDGVKELRSELLAEHRL